MSMLTESIERGVPLLVLAPHLDDAALSCGALMIHAASRTRVTVATLFTEAGEAPHTLSARRYLHQVGAQSAQTLYQERRAEDRAVLEPLGIRCVHANLTEALFRRRSQPGRRSVLAHVLPEVVHTYPVYRIHITSGHIAAADARTLHDACNIIQTLAESGPTVVLAPLGVGGHVDHVLVRAAAEDTGIQLIYYSDFPYNQRRPLDGEFIRRKGLVEARWSRLIEAKANLIRGYRTQVRALFRDGDVPIVPDVYFFPDGSGLPEERKKR